jgi:hypothetical protein
MFVPAQGQFRRDQYRSAVENWLRSIDFQLSVTLNFNRPTNHVAARDKWGEWLQRIDSQYLGCSWQKVPARRAFGIAFFENQLTNPHLHVLMNLPNPPPTRLRHGKLRRPCKLSWHAQNLEQQWGKLVKPGSCDVEAIYGLKGITRYVAKQLGRPGYDETFIISTEYQNL